MPEKPESPPDVESWIAAARGGDAAAVDRLCQHFEAPLRSHVSGAMWAHVRRWVQSEDVVNRTLYEVLGSLDALPAELDEQELLRRLKRVATFRVIDFARAFRNREGESILGSAGVDVPTPGASTGAITHADDRRWLRELIARLPEKYREVVRLCGLERRTFAEAAAELDLSADTVKKRYQRARDKLIAGSALGAEEG